MSVSLNAEDQNALIRAVASNRDREAFVRLFDYFAPRLNAYLQRLGASTASAEDMTQDVMQVMWQKAGLFDPAKSSLATWLYRIARNRRIDAMRRDRIDYYDPLDTNQTMLLDKPAEDPNPETLLLGWQRESLMREALALLPQDQIDLIKLAFFEELSHSQIAEKTGLPLGTIKSRIRLAFVRLRRQLEAAGLSD